jgi:hypothetical protein
MPTRGGSPLSIQAVHRGAADKNERWKEDPEALALADVPLGLLAATLVFERLSPIPTSCSERRTAFAM